MSWDAVKFDWNQARAFLATAEEGSLSAAARNLGQTQPTLGRQVTALEEDLGIALFERVGRSLELTPAGRDLMGHVQVMRDAAERLSLVADGQSQEMKGRVCITASDLFTLHLLPPFLRQLRDRAPKLELDLVAVNDVRDLQRREADIAMRHVRPEQGELIARLVAEVSGYFYASRSYIARAGRPETLEGLKAHEFVSFGDAERQNAYLRAYGIDLSRENYRIGSANGIVAWEMARQGFGIAPMSDIIGDPDPEMERLLPDMEPIVIPVWLTTHRELHSSRRIRLVFDMLADFLIRELGKPKR